LVGDGVVVTLMCLSSQKLPHMEHKKVNHLATLGFLDSRVMDMWFGEDGDNLVGHGNVIY
jgi:hypothetical protein